MHLPGPLRAAVGLVATAADEVRHLPERAVELPMLAVSTAMQVSLRAQQRYARLAARGEQVLNPEQTGAEPPQWATFDEPVTPEELRRAAMAQLDSLSGSGGSSRFFDELFGVSDPAEPAGGGAADAADPAVDRALHRDGADAASDPAAGDDVPTATVTPITATPSAARRTPARNATKTPAKKATAKKATAKKATAKKSPPTKAAPAKTTDDAVDRGKTVNKPRHTAPSKFDDVDDD